MPSAWITSMRARSSCARLSLAPGHADTMFALARVMQDGGEFAQAADMYRQLIAIEPGDAGSRIGLGICLIETGQSEEGFASLRPAAETNPKMYGEVLAALASCGHGRFWLTPGDAERVLRGRKT